MSKWIISADWHISDYPDYNFKEGARLEQFITLAHRLVELGKNYGSETLVIAGDLVDAPTMQPHVLHVVQDVLTILKSGFTHIYYILGQHDLETKSKTHDKKYTAVSLFDDDKFIYMNHKVITDGNCKIGFQNWNKGEVQDTDWLTEHLDYLIGHYTKSSMFGQEIDDTKFDWMIHGDIHNDQELGKFISVGNPIQKDMSSLSDGSIIILDTVNKSFERVRIDEDHSRFLRMNYTDKFEDEGFHGPLQYYIYRPTSIVNGEALEIKLPEWTDIEDLILKCVSENNLTDIHNRCQTECLPYRDIDFNFQLSYIKVQGYRSVVNFEVRFDGNDRILLLGENGSGKSSIMEGIYHIFNKNRYLANEQSDFSDSMNLEAGIFYQNKMYIIRRGNNWGLSIDGEEQSYNKKADFEADVVDKLPFLEYSDLFFIHSDSSNLAYQFTPDRRIELISKFYRLGKIDSLAETASAKWEEVNSEISKVKEERLKQLGVQEYIINQKSVRESDIQGIDRDATITKYNELSELREKYYIYKDWKDQIDGLKVTRKLHIESNQNYEAYLKIDIVDLRDQRSKLEAKLTEINETIKKESLNWQSWTNYRVKLKEMAESGKQLKEQYNKVYFGTCPTCGKPLDEGEKNEMTQKYGNQLIAARNAYINVNTEYEKLCHFKEDKTIDDLWYKRTIDKLESQKKPIQDEINDLTSKESLYTTAIEVKKKNDIKIEELNKKIEELEKLNIQVIELPGNLDSELKSAEEKIHKLQLYDDICQREEECTVKLMEIENKLKPLQTQLDDYNKYYYLMSRTGQVYREILKKLAESFSDENIEYRVDYGTSRGKDWLSFNAYYKVRKKFRVYESLSSGQKNIADLDFLSKLFAHRVGLLSLDESLKHLDENKSLRASEILNKMNVNSLIISTHSSNYPIFTKKIFLELDSDGRTVYSTV